MSKFQMEIDQIHLIVRGRLMCCPLYCINLWSVVLTHFYYFQLTWGRDLRTKIGERCTKNFYLMLNLTGIESALKLPINYFWKFLMINCFRRLLDLKIKINITNHRKLCFCYRFCKKGRAHCLQHKDRSATKNLAQQREFLGFYPKRKNGTLLLRLRCPAICLSPGCISCITVIVR